LSYVLIGIFLLYPAGRLPLFLVAGLLPSKTFLGNYTTRPFYFEPNRLASIKIVSDNTSLVYQGLDVNFDTSTYMQAYYTTLSAFGSSRYAGNGVSFLDYKAGHCLYVFELKSAVHNEFLTGEREGSLKAELSFSSATTSALTLVLLGVSQSLLMIDADRNASVS